MMLSKSNLPSNGAIVNWLGDNTVTLAWASTHRCSGEEKQTQLAFITFSLCEQVTYVKLHHTTQLKSV